MGTGQDGFDGNFVIDGIVSGTAACPGTCFQVPNTNMLASTPVSVAATGSNVFPQVTVVWTNSNTIEPTGCASWLSGRYQPGLSARPVLRSGLRQHPR